MNKIKYYISVTFLFLLFSTISFSQDYFPLEVGNRWDYYVTINGPGYTEYENLTLEIIGIQSINGVEYFKFSKPFPLLEEIPNSSFIREEDKMIYFFNEEDSTDCFSFRFDIPVDSYYYNCTNHLLNVDFKDTLDYWGVSDIFQLQDFYWFSKNFGILNFLEPFIVSYDYELKGCLISGITYGILLDVKNDENQMPVKFTLFQNYPNPFNPTTTIKYQTPESRFVSLIVYDVLGNEIANLVNEEKPAGEYEVEFDGINLTSGIYFYQLKASSFVETKKMILMQ